MDAEARPQLLDLVVPDRTDPQAARRIDIAQGDGDASGKAHQEHQASRRLAQNAQSQRRKLAGASALTLPMAVDKRPVKRIDELVSWRSSDGSHDLSASAPRVDEFEEGAAGNPLESAVRKATVWTPGSAPVPVALRGFVQWASSKMT